MWCAEGQYEPTDGLVAYLRRWPATEADPVRLVFGVRRGAVPNEVALDPHVHVASPLPGRGLRDLAVEYMPLSYFELCQAIVRGEQRVDAAIVVGRPVEEGHDLGLINGYLQIVLDRAGIVVVEEVPDLPVVAGAAIAHRADLVVSGAEPAPYVSLSGRPDEISARIAGHVADLANDASALMLGVGRVASAIAEILEPRRPMRMITGAVGESTLRLAHRGVLDERHPVQAMSVVGPPSVIEWACASSRVALLSSQTVHSPQWLSRHEGLVVVLGALAVDPSGNLNAERVGDRQVSGRGGAPDFAEGARASRGGRVVAALPSRSPNGDSNLVRVVDAVTVPDGLVDAVATEHGLAVRGTDEKRWRTRLEQIFA